MKCSCAILFALLAACGGEADIGAVPAPERVPLVGGEIPPGVIAGTPNVLVITIDTLRADHLGFQGYPRETSPFLDELAAESIVFERAYAPIATTLPSHTSMFTGVMPHEHGVLANIADGRTYRRRTDLETLPQLFEAAGYVTHAIVSAYPLRAEFGLDAGFDGYDAPDQKQRVANDTTTAALAAIAVQVADERPGFVWVHYFDPHGPYTPPLKFTRRFHADEAFLSGLAARGFVDEARRPTGQWNVLSKGIDAYDAEIAFVDRQIQRLLFRAEEAGWLGADTIVVVVADHGEGLNQHGVPGHGLVWEEQLHVPLLFRVPGVAARRITNPVSIVDLAPTLLHLLDLPGQNEFLEQVTGVDRFAPTARDLDLRILGQTSPRQSVDAGIGYSLRAGRWKLHRDVDGTLALYDLELDPDELTDVSATNLRVTGQLARSLDELLARQKGEVITDEASAAARAQLQSLGYGGDDGDR